jgi:hypothetical protein
MGQNTASALPLPAPVVTQPLDLGPVMLRCLGADGAFTFDGNSDDFVVWAIASEPIDLTKTFGVPYRFAVVPPVGEQCRFFRAPFPAGVEPPAPPPPPPPGPPPAGG